MSSLILVEGASPYTPKTLEGKKKVCGGCVWVGGAMWGVAQDGGGAY